jgi:hypothetical protein
VGGVRGDRVGGVAMSVWITVTGFGTGVAIDVQVSCIACIADPDPEGAQTPMLQLSMGGSVSIREDRAKVRRLIREAENA